MNATVVLLIGVAIGAVLAWLVQSARGQASKSALAAQLAGALANESRLREELAGKEKSLSDLAARLQTEASARAAAEAKTEQLDRETARTRAVEQRAETLAEELRRVSERRVELETESSRIPDLVERLQAAEVRGSNLNQELSQLIERHGRTESALEADRQTLFTVRKDLAHAREELATAHRTVVSMTAENADLRTRLEAERTQGQKQIELLNEVRASFSDNFKALSNDALQNNNRAFLDLANATLERFQEGAKGDLEARQKAVDQLVRPIAESLQKVDGKLGDIEKDRLQSYSELNTQLKGLVETHLPGIRSETANLVKALRQPTVRGRWGELQLTRVVEMAGMLDHCDFIEQDSRAGEDGRQLRPDLIVKLPGGRSIIIDAKAPFAGYLDAIEATDEATQRLHMARHAQQVRTHITALGRKGYWEQFAQSPDFVVMFIPGEAFFSAALQEDPSLIEYGVSTNVIPATPTTLIALLRAVAYGWRQEKLAQNAEEISNLGKELYERVAKLGEHWSDVGDRLGKAVDAYNRSVSTLESRVLVSARRFRDLKASSDCKEIDVLDPIELAPRAIQAEELVSSRLAPTLGSGASANDALGVRPSAA